MKVDHYNASHPEEEPLQIVFNFEEDIESKYERTKTAASIAHLYLPPEKGGDGLPLFKWADIDVACPSAFCPLWRFASGSTLTFPSPV
jgi:hypothetical protein